MLKTGETWFTLPNPNRNTMISHMLESSSPYPNHCTRSAHRVPGGERGRERRHLQQHHPADGLLHREGAVAPQQEWVPSA